MLLLATDPVAPRKHTSTKEQALAAGFSAISNLRPQITRYRRPETHITSLIPSQLNS